MRTQKGYYSISLFSLSVGLAGVIILLAFLQSELSYDRYHSNHDNIYRLITRVTLPAGLGVAEGPVAGFAVGPMMARDFPQLDKFVRFNRSPLQVFQANNATQSWGSVFHVDASVFEVFNHEILHGDPGNVFMQPNTVAVSESFARHYFNRTNVIGERVTSEVSDYQIGLVYKDLPENVHLQYDVLLPMAALNNVDPDYLQQQYDSIWSSSFLTYFKTTDAFNQADFEGIADKFYQERMAPTASSSIADFEMELQPLTKVHFGPDFMNDEPVGNILYIYGFSAVATFLLLISILNYINLTTSQVIARNKELMIKKTLGASRVNLGLQFFIESITISLTSVVIAYLLVFLTFNSGLLNQILQKTELQELLLTPVAVVQFIMLGILVGIVSAIYPAISVTSLSGQQTIKKSRSAGLFGMSASQWMLLTQLSITVAIIACASLTTSQIQYLSSKPLGFTPDNRILVELNGANSIESIPLMKELLLNNPNISNVTSATYVPGTGNAISILEAETENGTNENINVAYLSVDQDYIDSMGIELLEGNNFSGNRAPESSVIVNQTLVRQMGWDMPLGKSIGRGTVIGVVEDFHYRSLNEEIQPMTLWLFSDDFSSLSSSQRLNLSRFLIISFTPEMTINNETIREIRSSIQQFDTTAIVEPMLLSQEISAQYQEEESLSVLVRTFSIVSIIISMAGLFGVISYIVAKRRKEIAIRRISGASVIDIAALLSKKLIVVIALASIPTCLLSYFFADIWLSSFAYRIDINLFYFLGSFGSVALLTLALVLITTLSGVKSGTSRTLKYD